MQLVGGEEEEEGTLLDGQAETPGFNSTHPPLPVYNYVLLTSYALFTCLDRRGGTC